MRVALIKPPATYANWYKTPVLGLGYVQSSLSAQGHAARIFDACFNGWSRQELLDRVREWNPEIIGCSAMTHEIDQAASLATDLKRQLHVTTVIGGCHTTALPRRTLEEYTAFDFGVVGEGEATSIELMDLIAGGRSDPRSILGLVFRDSGSVIVNDKRRPISEDELAALPGPDYTQYYKPDGKALSGRHDFYVILTSRGCPYDCVFCMQVLGRKVRRRTAASVLAEVEDAIGRFGAHTIDFADEIFLMDHPVTREILHGMIDRGLNKRVRWSGLTRANLVKAELIDLARRAGCYRLSLGVESGDDQVLRNLQKRITVEQVRNAVRIIRSNGLQVATYYILGNPGETRETARRTLDLAAELNTNTIAIGTMVPYPGTRIHEMARSGEFGYRLLSENWADYDKYGGHALRIPGFTHEELAALQKKGLLLFYVRNLRFLDLMKYAWSVRHAIRYFIQRRIARVLPVSRPL